MKKRRFFRRALAIAVLTTLASANAFGISTKYYQTNLYVSPTGAGTVYASVNYTKPADSEFGATSTTGAVLDSVSYAFAKPAVGKGFLNWTQGGSVYSTDNPVMIVNQSTTGTQSNPATISLVANFVDAAVAVISDNEVFGTVSVNNVANEIGDAVVLTATPSTNTFKASEFEGWYLNGTKVSEDNPYTISVITASNSGIYTAKFTRKAGYFRIKSQYTGKYAYLFGDTARQSNSSTDGFSGIIFDSSIALKAANQLDLTDPGYIVKIDGITEGYNGGLKDMNVTCQGVDFKQMVNQHYPNADLDANPSGNYWTFSYDYNGARYFKDGTNYGYNYAIACGGASDHLWTLEPVDSIPLSYEVEINGKLCTTLYTKFPYRCSDGVKAYYMTADGYPTSFTHIENENEDEDYDVIPSNTPVMLRWDEGEPAYITPLFEEPSVTIEDNILVGVINLNNNQTVITNTTYILGINNDNRLSFINVYDSSTTQTIPSNKVYLDANLLNASSRGIMDVSGIERVSISPNEDTIFDLNGRKVEMTKFGKGLYIINGKKVIIK